MILLANILIGLAQVLSFVINTVIILLVLRAVLSWLNLPSANAIAYFCAAATEPIVAPIRRRIPQVGPLDLSFLAVFVVLMLLQTIVVQTLVEYAQMLKVSR